MVIIIQSGQGDGNLYGADVYKRWHVRLLYFRCRPLIDKTSTNAVANGSLGSWINTDYIHIAVAANVGLSRTAIFYKSVGGQRASEHPPNPY